MILSAFYTAIPERVIPKQNSSCSEEHMLTFFFSTGVKETDASGGGKRGGGEISDPWNTLKFCLCGNDRNHSVCGT